MKHFAPLFLPFILSATASAKEMDVAHFSWIDECALSTDGSTAATLDKDDVLKVWDTENGLLRLWLDAASMGLDTDRGVKIGLSGDGRWAVLSHAMYNPNFELLVDLTTGDHSRVDSEEWTDRGLVAFNPGGATAWMLERTFKGWILSKVSLPELTEIGTWKLNGGSGQFYLASALITPSGRLYLAYPDNNDQWWVHSLKDGDKKAATLAKVQGDWNTTWLVTPDERFLIVGTEVFALENGQKAKKKLSLGEEFAAKISAEGGIYSKTSDAWRYLDLAAEALNSQIPPFADKEVCATSSHGGKVVFKLRKTTGANVMSLDGYTVELIDPDPWGLESSLNNEGAWTFEQFIGWIRLNAYQRDLRGDWHFRWKDRDLAAGHHFKIRLGRAYEGQSNFISFLLPLDTGTCTLKVDEFEVALGSEAIV
ncbi:MAG: hypothetical protein HN348_32170, partial [Proteobacteria bacterium]|nr:hypothetical protein [Pseudomonadota bacterium]